jgi:hypothetical protein
MCKNPVSGVWFLTFSVTVSMMDREYEHWFFLKVAPLGAFGVQTLNPGFLNRSFSMFILSVSTAVNVYGQRQAIASPWINGET